MKLPWAMEVYVESEGDRWDGVQVQRLRGREAIGELFALEIDLVLDQEIDLDARLHPGVDLTIVIERDREEVRRIHGMVRAILDRFEVPGETRTYRVTVVPRLAQLALVQTQEVYLQMSIPDIIRRKLEMHGFSGEDFELRLVGSYEAREIVVQHGETDLALVSRLAEHVGISFYFEHESGKDKAVFTDHTSGFSYVEDHVSVPFRPRGEQLDVFALDATTQLLPGRVFVQDYNYRTPLLDPTATADADPEGLGGIVEYGSHVKSPEDASTIAQVRAQEILATKRVLRGESSHPNLSAGRRVELLDHPRLAARQVLLVTEVEHEAHLPLANETATVEAGYRNTFRAITEDVVFRPARRTPRPRMHGVVTGVVQPGPGGEIGGVAKLDAEGRYTVQIHFDTAPHRGAKASHAVRMAQPFAGHGNGMHFPLLPGTEVIVAFANGDPDRPIIVGAMPNPVSPAPVVADESHTHRIRSSQGVVIEFGQTVPGRS